MSDKFQFLTVWLLRDLATKNSVCVVAANKSQGFSPKIELREQTHIIILPTDIMFILLSSTSVLLMNS